MKYYFIANNIKCNRKFETRIENNILIGQFLSSLWFNQQLYINRDFYYNICNSQNIIIKDTIKKETIHKLYNSMLPETNDKICIYLPENKYYWKINFSVYKNNHNIIYIYCPQFETNQPLHISHPSSSSSSTF